MRMDFATAQTVMFVPKLRIWSVLTELQSIGKRKREQKSWEPQVKAVKPRCNRAFQRRVTAHSTLCRGAYLLPPYKGLLPSIG
jgi:hypothetical protein